MEKFFTSFKENLEIFCMADDFRKFFDVMTAQYTLKPIKKKISSRFYSVKNRLRQTGHDFFLTTRAIATLSISSWKSMQTS